MKKFLLILHEDIGTIQKLSPEEMKELVNSHKKWATKLGEQGYLVAGDGLEETGFKIEGKECVIKDGPYIKSNKKIGGYYLLQAEDLQTIVDVAKGCPCHLWGGITEVRPIMDYNE